MSSLLTTPKVLAGLFVTMLITSILIGAGLLSGNQSVQGINKNKIKITPVININSEKSKCLNSNPLEVNVSNPFENQEFNTGVSIPLKATVSFKCANLFKAGEFQIKHGWYLGDAANPFSESLSHTLSNTTPGSHKVVFKVEVKIPGFETLKTAVTRNFKVKTAVTATPTPTEVPNQVPTATIITPVAGTIFFESYFNNQCHSEPIRFSGTGTDIEDGTLSGTSLRWYYQRMDGGVKTFLNTGNNFTQRIQQDYFSDPDTTGRLYTIFLEVTDSDGSSFEVQRSIYINTNGCG